MRIKRPVEGNRLWWFPTLAVVLLSGCTFEVDTAGMVFSKGEPDTKVVLDDAVLDGAVHEVSANDVLLAELQEVAVAEDAFPETVGPDTVIVCEEHSDCDDGIACTQDVCAGNDCEHTPLDSNCDGGDFCRGYACSIAEAGCIPQARNIGKECTGMMNDKCVTNAVCNDDGQCVPTEEGYVDCPESQCLKDGECDPASGECQYAELTGPSCDDENPCTYDTKCINGDCQGKFDSGACPCATNEDCIEFDDGDLCNGQIHCLDEFCSVVPDSVVVCSQPPPGSCFEVACNPATGDCDENPLAPGGVCDDSNPCTGNDKCDGEGSCTGEPVGEEPCELDNDKCTDDVCEDGICTPGPAKACIGVDTGPCFDHICDPASGTCKDAPLPNGAPCEDDDECTIGEQCYFTSCTGGVNICADCTDPDQGGHACDDGNPDTGPDLCFEHQCTGFTKHVWSDAESEAMHLPFISSVNQTFHALGLKLKANQEDVGAHFVEFDSGGKLGQESVYPGAGLGGIDGRVAVGAPDRVYYYGVGWTTNNSLEEALAQACPSMDDKHFPAAVAHRTLQSGSITPDGTGFDQMAAFGFNVKSSISAGKCVLAVCGRLSGGSWVCTPHYFKEVTPGYALPGVKPRVSALWLPDSPKSCAEPSAACFSSSDSLYFAVTTTIAGGYRIYIARGWSDDPTGGSASFEVVYQEDVYSSPEVVKAVTDMRADKAGNLFAVGTNDFIFVRGKNGASHTIDHLAVLGPATVHYYGIYRSNKTTVLAANLLISTVDELGAATTLLQTGVVAGAPGILFDETGTAKAFFSQFASFHLSCPDCYEGDLGTWGTTDMTFLQAHLEDPESALATARTLAISGTVPLTPGTKAIGAVAVISAE